MNANDYRATASEAQVLQAVCKILRMHAAVGTWWRANTGAAKYGDRHVKFGVPGQPDLMVILNRTGRFLAIEVKRPGAKPTQDQTAFLNAVTRAGGLAAVVHSAAEALEILDRVLVTEL